MIGRQARAVPTARSWWERGTAGAELPCTGQPEWAEFAESAVAAVTALRVPGGELPGTTGFAAVLTPFAELTRDRFLADLPQPAADLPAADLPVADLDGIRADFVGQLAGTLARQAARTLVLELNVARVQGRLDGGTPAERFRSFLALVGSRQGLSALFGEYPVLARLLAQTCRFAGAALAELLERFAADRAEIVAALLSGTDPGPLVAVERTTGDGHQRGRAVGVLRFADGARVVYKPRSPRAHGRFNEMVGWFNAQPGTPGLRALALIERDGYGWVEFAAARPCAAERELELFYLRQGAWLALLYALDATDLHFENLIACGDEPVLVDVETLFHPVAPAGPEEDPAARALGSSVNRSCLLPHLLVGDDSAVDLSGLGGEAGHRSPVEGVAWANSGTDEMRLVRRAGELAGAANRPRLGAVAADPAGFTGQLVAGFRAGYRAIEAGRGELTGPHGLLQQFADAQVRVVARDTHAYATLLDESTHPDVLREAAERDALLRLLETDAFDAVRWTGLLDEEIAELWDGDVPLFTTRPGSVDLWSGTGRRIPGVLDRTGLDRAAEKIRAMGPRDLDDQEWIIRAAMATRSTRPGHAVGRVGTVAGVGRRAAAPVAAPAPDRLVAAARTIADQLLDRAYRNGTRTNWLGLELLADRYWRVRPAGADLGAGFTGVALFLAQLADLTGEAGYAQAARSALRPVPRLLEELADRREELGVVGSGAFAGLGGIAYALTQVSTLLDDAEIGSWIAAAVDLTTAAARVEEASGVFDGTAGGLATLLAVHQATGSAAAWTGARLCAARLAERPLPAAPGFGTGSAGVGWALLRFAAQGGGAAYERAGLAALGAAAGHPAPDRPAPDRYSWCAGLPGIALAVADSGTLLSQPVRPALAQCVEHAVGTLASSGPLPDHSLCHGELGALELLLTATPQTTPQTAPQTAPSEGTGRAGALLAALDRRGPLCGTPGELTAPGLLTGLAGIGHGLLRLAHPDRTASALLLRPSTISRLPAPAP
ncbi:type 2 lantibiotic biosynthesis protein LanM [Kitasatospora sp. MAP12-15]|uniref:type 2 lanthipeptide synthetase LanM family protein n=1 Tax=unclassified Kitasatospora TaxID=2633591 RepID=UPI002473AB1C|nr:type 2 lanthipeptide synthetase LanM family protein [Kitasatospora sp. MAP12-44]MDH6109625.1 type 2 lantibiotic biosynthesis protein LanM [Kitasatospora sp. MAP12-44]